ncbi:MULTISPECIES: ion channel protein [Streptomyces]|uniref:Ion channel protein n=1 Tax=Streptomyces doudnae TaxID=3075536 RepID=A0ABD5EYC2_9ACTN|nr:MULTISPECIES: ion channel protein [unclassified Streptomyces]MDT0439766.1 ion channel protein [Streptomyces sp. DSM 41981]MYQ68707.1 ion channel protein [Streptomyces sp. SID4950]SCE48338.1 H+/Cl-antiporter ClcA [Streptomyces sp. SolWspMP-5a-2]
MASDTAPPRASAPSARALSASLLPALVVGVVASLLFVGVSEAAELLQGVLWKNLPDALGVGRYSVLWMLVMLTATGVAVGLVVWKVPGHAGPDPATLGLDAPVLPPTVLPGLLLAVALMLAGGPSLGPENPIIAVNVGLAFWLGSRFLPRVPGALWPVLAESATIGALFGTPVAAALVISEALAGRRTAGPLWSNLFAPLAAAAAGALTTSLVAHPTFDLGLPGLARPGWADLLSALVVASLAALLGMLGVAAFPYAHALFRRLPHPMLALPAGGLVLGLLAALGGHLTLFKGLSEIGTLARDPDGWTFGQFLTMAVVKLAALVVAASCGFRGGRIFPSVFIGVALGMAAHALVPGVDLSVGVAAGVLGMLLAVTRQGWVSLFTAAVLVDSPAILALLCFASLPAWLLVTGRPQMQLHDDGSPVT